MCRGSNRGSRFFYAPKPTASTPFPSPVTRSFNQRTSELWINQNAINLEAHVATGPCPHFGVTDSTNAISRPVAQHSWTSASYQDVMNSITDVSPPQQQSNNNYMAVATLSSRIPTNSVNSDRFSLDAKRGTTSHVYLFGQGNGFGFSNIATMFPAPSSPPPTGYWQYVP